MIRTLLLFLLISHTVTAQVNLNFGLLAHYPFNGNANDASGNGNNGIPQNGIQLTTDRFGNPNSAYYFDGIDDHILVNDNGNLSPKKITVVAIVYPESATAQSISGKIQRSTGFHATYHVGINYDIQAGFFWGLAPPNSSCFQQIPYNPNNPFITSPQYFSVNNWHCVVGTFEDSVQKLYVDGILVQTRIYNFKDLDSCINTNFLIGRWWDGDPIPFKGKIDEVRVYNRAINQQEVNALCLQIPCNNWLNLPSQPSYANVGDLDIPGNQVTVEALINRTTPYSHYLLAGDVVTKHSQFNDVNYLLRPNNAEITTTTGYYLTPQVCDIQLNKTYHVAMVYDGSFLKFYRNGILMSQIAATGSLIQNNWQTRIGFYEFQFYNENFIGYINEVRIWNVAKTQAQIQTYMNTSLPVPTTQPGLLAYYTFNNLLNKQGNPAWNATLSGPASINNINPSCTLTPDNCLQPACTVKSDFTQSRDLCNPLNVSMLTNSTGYNSISWDFGDGNIASGTTTPSNLYASTGNYQVTLIQHFPTCSDTVRKQVTVDLQNDPALITTQDTTYCFGTTKQIKTQPALGFCWSPVSYLDNPALANPTTSTTQNITYYFTAEVTGANVISNGNFSAGNTGFTSAYTYANPNVTEGQYFVGPSPQAWNTALSNCTDHTGGNGNMMLVNGSPTPNVNVWRQTVTVTPNTNYAFSTWIQALWPPNPAQLQFSINGKDVGTLITASLPTCTWTRFYTTWNSGSNTSADISIVNKNTAVQGNDFALDDISFAPVFVKRDSVRITIDRPVVQTSNDATVCQGTPVQLNTTGASGYSWTPANGLNNSNIGNPVATPNSTTQYIVTGTTTTGCTAKDTVNITIYPPPVVITSNDTTVCPNTPVQLYASGGTSYSWSPAATLSDPSIANPVATPLITTMYYVLVTDNNSCTSRDSVKLSIGSSVFTINAPATVCQNESLQLSASGGHLYSWQPAGSLDNPSLANPTASPLVNTTYSVQITDTVCHNSSTLSTDIAVLPLPVIQATKSNDIDCSVEFSQLNAAGGVQYLWQPASTLNNASGQNPIARPAITTQYILQGTDQFGCVNYDSITVNVLAINKGGYLMPNAFTPNNDGRNDCYGIKYWGVIQELEFSIYNRWGERLFYTTNPQQCWDGTYKGIKQDPAAFIYMIKAKSFCESFVFRKGSFVLIR